MSSHPPNFSNPISLAGASWGIIQTPEKEPRIAAGPGLGLGMSKHPEGEGGFCCLSFADAGRVLLVPSTARACTKLVTDTAHDVAYQTLAVPGEAMLVSEESGFGGSDSLPAPGTIEAFNHWAVSPVGFVIATPALTASLAVLHCLKTSIESVTLTT